MKTLYYQCNSGISGDMNLAALVDLGVPKAHLQQELAKLNLGEEFTLSFTPASKMGIHGTRAKVSLAVKSQAEQHHHRPYKDICQLIDSSPYSEKVKSDVHRMFRFVAEAEAKIHAQALDKVHFHEVGATDSIVDFFGAAIALDYLQIDQILCSEVELGSGEVNCEHGILPVPAPATLEILKGVPCRMNDINGEATTPTGAAILKSFVKEFKSPDKFVPTDVGYGIGHKDFSKPNVLRITLGEVIEEIGKEHTNTSHLSSSYLNTRFGAARNVEIKANIDDMSPEAFEPLLEKLFEAEASDAFLTPIVMKKSRLAQMLTVLCQEQHVEQMLQIIYANSTTIGVRIQPVHKHMLTRSMVNVPTSFGDARVKLTELPNKSMRWKVEHDDIKAFSLNNKKTYLEIRKLVNTEVDAYFSASLGAN